MSVSFHGPGTSTLDVNNGLADRLLQALGHPPSVATHGEMSIAMARAGVVRAWRILQGTEDAKYLGWLEELIADLEKEGETKLRWD